MVSSAIHSTADTVRPALSDYQNKPGISRTSGVFLMNRENTDHRLMFADCAINIEPNAQELAEIAINTAETAKVFVLIPKWPCLASQQKGSAKSPKVDRVVQANIAKEMCVLTWLLMESCSSMQHLFQQQQLLRLQIVTQQGHANVFVFLACKQVTLI